VLADSLRTDVHSFHAVHQDDPVVIRLCALSRLDADIADEQNRINNQFREQLFRFFPQLLKLSPSVDEPWLWELFQMAPLPAKAARLSETKIARVLRDHRIRPLDAGQVRTALAGTPLTLAPELPRRPANEPFSCCPVFAYCASRESKSASGSTLCWPN
jgi:hypothetical protein